MNSSSSSIDPTDKSNQKSELQHLRDKEIRLHQTNSDLNGELDQLRKHCKEVSVINGLLEESHKENIKVSDELRKVKLDNDDLSRRLQISLKTIEELKETVSQQNRNQTNQIYAKTISNENPELTLENRCLKERLANCTEEKRKAEAFLALEKKKTASFNEISKQVLYSFQNYFGVQQQSFNTLESIVDFLKQHETEIELKRQIVAQRDQTEQIKSLIVALKKMKIKVKKEKGIRRKMENELRSIESIGNKENGALKEETMRLKSQLAAAADRQTSLYDITQNSQILEINKKEQQVSSLQKENANLKIENEELKNKIKELSIQVQQQQMKQNHITNDSLINKINKEKKNNNTCQFCTQYREQISDLSQENERIRISLNESNRQNNSLKIQNDTISFNNQKQSNEIAQLRIIRDEFEGKYNTTSSQLSASQTQIKQLQSEKNDIENSLKRTDLALSQVDRLFHTQKSDISMLFDHRNHLTEMIYKLRSIIQKEESIIEKLISENKAAKKKYKSLKKTSITNQVQKKSLDEEIPATSFYCKDFDAELCDKISEFANNEAFPINAKLKHVFMSIARHYNEKGKEYEGRIEKSERKNNALVESINFFLNNISASLNISSDFTIETISNPVKVGEMINHIDSTVSLKKELINMKDYYEEVLKNLISKLRVKDCEEIFNEIDLILKSNEEKQERLENLASKYKALRKSFKEATVQLNRTQSEKNEILAKKEKMISNLVQKNDDLSSKLAQIETSMMSMNSTIKGDTDKNEKKVKIRMMADQQVEALQQEIIQLKDKHQKNLSEFSLTVDNQRMQIERLEKDVEFWKQNAALLKNMQNQKEKEIQKLQFEYEKYEDESKQQNFKEIEKVRQQYETIVSSLKNKNQELRTLTENLSSDFNAGEKHRNSLQKQVCDLTSEKERMVSKIDMLTESQNRSMQILDQKIKAIQIANETKYQNQVSDLTSNFSLEKRKLMSFTVKYFCKFFDANRTLDEKAFKETVEKTSLELEKLSNQDSSIRRLLGITQVESVEQSISQLLKLLYHQT